jgi:glycosyltransferase involved in cell wall biosynthesis
MDFTSSPFEAIMSRRYSRTFLFNQRNMNENGHRPLLKIKAKAAQRIICLSEAVIQLMRRFASHQKLVKVHPGIEVERISFRRPGPSSNGTFRLLMVGHVVRRKRLEDGITALAESAPEVSGLRLQIAGRVVDPSYLQELKAMVRACGLGERVSFLGPRNDVFELMGQADVLLHTAESEAFGMVLIEAMAAGLPVVAAAIDGPREIIEHGRSGLLVPPGDPRGYAEAIRRLVQAPDLAIDLALNARKRVETHFSARRMAEQTAAVYDELCPVPSEAQNAPFSSPRLLGKEV